MGAHTWHGLIRSKGDLQNILQLISTTICTQYCSVFSFIVGYLDSCFFNWDGLTFWPPGLNRISTLIRWEGRLVHTDPSIGLDEEAAARMLETVDSDDGRDVRCWRISTDKKTT